MAKMACISGAVVGKIGGNVFSVNSGQQIVRAYQPNVANPNTGLQVANRTKFKLASQLAAVFSPVLAIPKKGIVSGRNQFVSTSMSYITANEGEDVANVQLSQLQLTKSLAVLPALTLTVGENQHIRGVIAAGGIGMGVTKVIFARFEAVTVNKLRLISTNVASSPLDDGTFTADLGSVSNHPSFVYAYGIIEGDSGILAKYQEYGVDDATSIATLVSSRTASASGLKTTTTRFAQISQNLNSNMAAGPEDSSSRGIDESER